MELYIIGSLVKSHENLKLVEIAAGILKVSGLQCAACICRASECQEREIIARSGVGH